MLILMKLPCWVVSDWIFSQRYHADTLMTITDNLAI